MNNWKNKIFNIGIISAGSSKKFSFELDNNNLLIVSAEATCSCTDLIVKKKTELTGKFTAKSIPTHLKRAGITKQTVTKTIKVKIFDKSNNNTIDDFVTIKAEVND